MGKLDNYKFGQVYYKKIEKEDADEFSSVFGGGSFSLTELIKYCILSDISTIACCRGHSEDRNLIEKPLETGYISFLIGDDKDLAYFLASIPHRVDGVTTKLESSNIYGKSLTLEVPAFRRGMSEKYFVSILDQLKEYSLAKKNGEKISLEPSIKPIVDYVYSSYGSECYVITNKNYKKREREGMYLRFVSKCSLKRLINR